MLHIFSDLSHNKLQRIPTNAFAQLSNLTTLDLSYNKIHRMMPGTVVPWRNLHTLNISGNDQLDLFGLRLTFYVSLIEFYDRISRSLYFRWDLDYDLLETERL